MSLLSLCQAVIKETGIGTAPTTVIGNTDPTAVQLLALATHEVRVLLRRHDWSILVAEQTINTVNGTESYALPSDIDRYVGNALWDATNYWQMRGSVGAPLWNALKRGNATSVTTRKFFRVKGYTTGGVTTKRLYIYPTPTAAESLVAEYITSTPYASNTGVPAAAFAADTDTTLIPEYLVQFGVHWRFLKAKGLDYAEERAEYDRMVNTAIAQEVPAPALNFGVSSASTPAFLANVPPNI